MMNLPSRAPIQVYLDADERLWLDDLATRLGVSRSEVLRRGVRRLRAEFSAPDSPLQRLLVLAAADPALRAAPSDLATRHRDYLVDTLLDRAAEGGAAQEVFTNEVAATDTDATGSP
jgi:Arc/MetJ-type ribon-helix-helix transcriptional regulator